jgi:hypothetical protein
MDIYYLTVEASSIPNRKCSKCSKISEIFPTPISNPHPPKIKSLPGTNPLKIIPKDIRIFQQPTYPRNSF